MKKQRATQYIIGIIPFLLVAGLAGAKYAAPTGAAPSGTPASSSNNTTVVPITVDTAPGVKDGGLSVYTFWAKGNANLAGDVYVSGQINAGIPADTATGATKYVSIGETATTVQSIVSGKFKTLLGLQSDTLISSTTQPICAKNDGTIILCSAPVVNVTPDVPVTYVMNIAFSAANASGPVINVTLDAPATFDITIPSFYLSEGGVPQDSDGGVKYMVSCAATKAEYSTPTFTIPAGTTNYSVSKGFTVLNAGVNVGWVQDSSGKRDFTVRNFGIKDSSVIAGTSSSGTHSTTVSVKKGIDTIKVNYQNCTA